ncbi:MAG: spore cortex biosynthesis protein YabQ [Clostridium sp.]|nr:spore cortex biosynthesis protein YabQ [Clostridium sp.]
MEVTLSSQLLSLGISVLVGLALAVVYDGFRVTRILFRTGKIAMYVQDILYGIAAAFATFLLALAVNYGEIRFYIIGGELIGMTVYFLTLGRITVRIAKWVHRICVKIALWLKIHVSEPIKRFYEKKKVAIALKNDKNKKRKKNSERNIENPLKPAPDIVYNRIKSFFIGSGEELKGGIPEDDTKL